MTKSAGHALVILVPLLAGGCMGLPMRGPPALQPEGPLLAVNAAINRQGPRCPRDYCQDHWPDAADLAHLDDWDCKAYAVAKADRLIREHGYAPARLEYLLIAGPALRVTHAALLVDGRWVMDIGLRCQVCELDQFVAGVKITGRLPVADLPLVLDALRQ